MTYTASPPHLALLTGVLADSAPDKILRRTLRPLLGRRRPRSILCLGKAAPSLARGAALWAPQASGLLYGTEQDGAIPDDWTALWGTHPLPGASNLECTARLERWAERAEGPVLVLVSGGTSALLVRPAPPWGPEEKAALTHRLLRSGASILEVNIVRARLSKIKGGGLRRLLGGPVWTGIWSDVGRSSFRVVGSAPTVSMPGSPAAHEILRRYAITPELPLPPDGVLRRVPPGDRCGLLFDARAFGDRVQRTLEERGIRVIRRDAREGESTRSLARRIARMAGAVRGPLPPVILGVGEPGVVVRGRGRGGRCTDLAAHLALRLRRRPGWSFLALATDGVDGSAGGGVALAASDLPKAGEIEEAIRANDTGTLWKRRGVLLPRHPTGNNLRDLWLLSFGADRTATP